MRDIIDGIGIVIIGIVVVALIVLLIWVLTTPLMYAECRITAETMSVSYRYNFWAGCFFQLNSGKWIAEEYYIVPILE